MECLEYYSGKLTQDSGTLKQASDFYHSELLKNPEALQYFHDRGLSDAAIDKFNLGYADKIRDSGISAEDLATSGLLKFGREFFHGRLTFPIINVLGKTIAFGARDFREESDSKYINSSESENFSKSDNLYGLWNLLETGELSRLILVEGYMDVIACQMAGFPAVAAMGTGVSWRHCSLISRFAHAIIILTDSDAPGKKSRENATRLFKEWNIQIYAAEVNGAKDPDEFINKYGPDSFKTECLDKAVLS